MSRDVSLYLEDIQTSCNKIMRYVGDLDFNGFIGDDRTYDAVIHNLEIIGEATRNVDENYRKKYPDIEWRAIGSLRNIVAHEYFGVNDEILWDIVTKKVPVLLDQLNRIVSN